MTEYHFIHDSAFIGDVKALFGDVEAIRFGDSHDMADLAVMARLFRSRSDAKRNGWGGPIPHGWTERSFGKRARVYILGPRVPYDGRLDDLRKIVAIDPGYDRPYW